MGRTKSKKLEQFSEEELLHAALALSQYEADSIPEGQIREMPTVTPSEEELMDPLRFMEKYWAQGEEYGAIKIVLPDYFYKQTFFDERLLKFKIRMQNLKELYSMEAFAFPPETWTIEDMRAVDQNFRNKVFGPDTANFDPAKVEEYFWNIVKAQNEDCFVPYGADIPTADVGSGFPLKTPPSSPFSAAVPPRTEEEIKLAHHPFNLNNLAMVRGSLLANAPRQVGGVTSPWLYIGGPMSCFCWHREDNYFASANFQHWGAPKIWYVVSSSKASVVDQVMQLQLTSCRKPIRNASNSLKVMIPPGVLHAAQSNICRTVQRPGEMVLLWPKAYHAGINTGLNCNEASNVAPPSWILAGMEAVQAYRHMRPETLPMGALIGLEASRRFMISALQQYITHVYNKEHPEAVRAVLTKHLPVELGLPRSAEVGVMLQGVILNIFRVELETRSNWLKKNSAIVEARLSPIRLEKIREAVADSTSKNIHNLQDSNANNSKNNTSITTRNTTTAGGIVDVLLDAEDRSRGLQETADQAQERRRLALRTEIFRRVALELSPLTAELDSITWPRPHMLTSNDHTTAHASNGSCVSSGMTVIKDDPNAPSSTNPSVQTLLQQQALSKNSIEVMLKTNDIVLSHEFNPASHPELSQPPRPPFLSPNDACTDLPPSAIQQRQQQVIDALTALQSDTTTLNDLSLSPVTSNAPPSIKISALNPYFARSGALGLPCRDCDFCQAATIVHVICCVHPNSRHVCAACARHHRCSRSATSPCVKARLIVRARLSHIASWCESLGVALSFQQKSEAAKIDWLTFKASYPVRPLNSALYGDRSNEHGSGSVSSLITDKSNVVDAINAFGGVPPGVSLPVPTSASTTTTTSNSVNNASDPPKNVVVSQPPAQTSSSVKNEPSTQSSITYRPPCVSGLLSYQFSCESLSHQGMHIHDLAVGVSNFSELPPDFRNALLNEEKKKIVEHARANNISLVPDSPPIGPPIIIPTLSHEEEITSRMLAETDAKFADLQRQQAIEQQDCVRRISVEMWSFQQRTGLSPEMGLSSMMAGHSFSPNMEQQLAALRERHERACRAFKNVQNDYYLSRPDLAARINAYHEKLSLIEQAKVRRAERDVKIREEEEFAAILARKKLEDDASMLFNYSGGFALDLVSDVPAVHPSEAEYLTWNHIVASVETEIKDALEAGVNETGPATPAAAEAELITGLIKQQVRSLNRNAKRQSKGGDVANSNNNAAGDLQVFVSDGEDNGSDNDEDDIANKSLSTKGNSRLVLAKGVHEKTVVITVLERFLGVRHNLLPAQSSMMAGGMHSSMGSTASGGKGRFGAIGSTSVRYGMSSSRGSSGLRRLVKFALAESSSSSNKLYTLNGVHTADSSSMAGQNHMRVGYLEDAMDRAAQDLTSDEDEEIDDDKARVHAAEVLLDRFVAKVGLPMGMVRVELLRRARLATEARQERKLLLVPNDPYKIVELSDSHSADNITSENNMTPELADKNIAAAMESKSPVQPSVSRQEGSTSIYSGRPDALENLLSGLTSDLLSDDDFELSHPPPLAANPPPSQPPLQLAPPPAFHREPSPPSDQSSADAPLPPPFPRHTIPIDPQQSAPLSFPFMPPPPFMPAPGDGSLPFPSPFFPPPGFAPFLPPGHLPNPNAPLSGNLAMPPYLGPPIFANRPGMLPAVSSHPGLRQNIPFPSFPPQDQQFLPNFMNNPMMRPGSGFHPAFMYPPGMHPVGLMGGILPQGGFANRQIPLSSRVSTRRRRKRNLDSDSDEEENFDSDDEEEYALMEQQTFSNSFHNNHASASNTSSSAPYVSSRYPQRRNAGASRSLLTSSAKRQRMWNNSFVSSHRDMQNSAGNATKSTSHLSKLTKRAQQLFRYGLISVNEDGALIPITNGGGPSGTSSAASQLGGGRALSTPLSHYMPSHGMNPLANLAANSTANEPLGAVVAFGPPGMNGLIDVFDYPLNGKEWQNAARAANASSLLQMKLVVALERRRLRLAVQHLLRLLLGTSPISGGGQEIEHQVRYEGENNGVIVGDMESGLHHHHV